MPELTPSQQHKLDLKLGKQTDASLAREYGITRQRVAQRRNAKNIPPYELGSNVRTVNVGTFITEADDRNMKKAIKKTGDKNKSEYIRGAIAFKNEDVLGEG